MKSETGWEREEAGQEKGFYEIIIYVYDNKNTYKYNFRGEGLMRRSSHDRGPLKNEPGWERRNRTGDRFVT